MKAINHDLQNFLDEMLDSMNEEPADVIRADVVGFSQVYAGDFGDRAAAVAELYEALNLNRGLYRVTRNGRQRIVMGYDLLDGEKATAEQIWPGMNARKAERLS